MMNSEPAVSIIIPVYNAEKRLKNCIDSVLNQSMSNIELILIDDGSKDNSPSICDNYAKQDCRVRVKHKKNGGVSSARNAGLKMARGTYVAFVDSDDSIERDFLEVAATRIEESEADGYYSGLVMETWKESLIVNKENYDFGRDDIISVKQLFDEMNKSYQMICICGPWCKLFRRTIIENYNLRFDESLALGEDTLFNLGYLSHCDFIFTSTHCGYHYYRGNEDSLFSKLNKDTYSIHIKVYDIMRKLINKIGCESETRQRFEVIYIGLLLGCIHKYFECTTETTRTEKMNLIKQVANNRYLKESDLSLFKIKTRYIIWLLKHNMISQVYLFFKLYYYMKKKRGSLGI